LAYLAGLIDGEGSITILKASAKNELYKPRLDICSIHKPFLEEIAGLLETLGVKSFFLQERTIPPNHSKAYHLIVAGQRRLLKLLPKLLPYLRLKRKQAELVIEYCLSRIQRSHKGPNPSRGLNQREKEIIAMIRELNRRGRRS